MARESTEKKAFKMLCDAAEYRACSLTKDYANYYKSHEDSKDMYRYSAYIDTPGPGTFAGNSTEVILDPMEAVELCIERMKEWKASEL